MHDHHSNKVIGDGEVGPFPMRKGGGMPPQNVSIVPRVLKNVSPEKPEGVSKRRNCQGKRRWWEMNLGYSRTFSRGWEIPYEETTR